MSVGGRVVVYTALLGGYEEFSEQPALRGCGFDLVCLTDRDDLDSETWSVRRIDPWLPTDLPRSAREAKLRPHRYFPDHDVSLWIDNSVRLVAPPEDLLAALLPAPEIGVGLMSHSFRETLVDEFAAVIAEGFDDPARVQEQLAHYAVTSPATLAQRPWWGAIIARRHGHPEIAAAMERWWTHVLRYSRRDQLSGQVAVGPDVAVHVLDAGNHASSWHVWPVAHGRDREAYRRSATSDLVPAVLRARRAEQEATSLRRQVDDLDVEVARWYEAARAAQEDVVTTRLAGADALADAAAQRDEARAALAALQASTSWRVTAPYRRARSVVHQRRTPTEGSPVHGAQEPPDVPVSGFEARMAEAYRQEAERRWPGVADPVDFDHLVWRKRLQDRSPLLQQTSDKVDVRDLVAARVGEQYLAQAYAVLDDPGRLRPNRLPRQFVAKAAHGSGGVAVVWQGPQRESDRVRPWWQGTYDCARVPWEDLRLRFRACLDRDFGDDRLEWAYLGLPRRILVEEVLRGEDGAIPDDIKLFVLAGRVRLIGRFARRFESLTAAYHLPDWTPTGFEMGIPAPHGPFPRPSRLDELIEVAEALAAGTDLVRVDLYDTAAGVKFGEITHYPGGGLLGQDQAEAGLALGRWAAESGR